jgi:hypothetical protein
VFPTLAAPAVGAQLAPPPAPRPEDFERTQLGPTWANRFPVPDRDGQLRVIDDSDLGLGPGRQGFFLVNWVGDQFDADQHVQATIPDDVNEGWIHQVYVPWRGSDGPRYGFGYDGDRGQVDFGSRYVSMTRFLGRRLG